MIKWSFWTSEWSFWSWIFWSWSHLKYFNGKEQNKTFFCYFQTLCKEFLSVVHTCFSQIRCKLGKTEQRKMLTWTFPQVPLTASFIEMDVPGLWRLYNGHLWNKNCEDDALVCLWNKCRNYEHKLIMNKWWFWSQNCFKHLKSTFFFLIPKNINGDAINALRFTGDPFII